MKKLTGSQRKFLRGQAHHLEPVVRVGQAGLSDGLMAELRQALASHELVKIKFVELKDRKRELCDEIARGLACECVGTIGHVAIFYRPAADPAERRFRLPEPKAVS